MAAYRAERTGSLADVVIIGGGPAGLSAALVLGRSRKHVVLFDGGPIRNAAARHVHGVVTRDGIEPQEFRRLGHEELRRYPSVLVHVDTAVTEIVRLDSGFVVRAAGERHMARRVLLCTGVVDELPKIDGCSELWGNGLLACPYCHGWDVRDARLGFLAPDAESLVWALLLRGWSRDVTVFTNGVFAVPPDARRTLDDAQIPIEERRIVVLRREGKRLLAARFDDGDERPCGAMFLRPVQRQVPVVAALGLALDDRGFVKVDDEQHTSIAGVYAAGDLVTHDHGALTAAASGSRGAHCLNHALTVELVKSGVL
jgi:thioredoxin reductase